MTEYGHGSGFLTIRAWRRFMQEMLGSRLREYEASRFHLGIRSERAWISHTRHGEQAIVVLEAQQPDHVLSGLITSDDPFDVWFRQQIRQLHGLDLAQSAHKHLSDLIVDWQA